MDDAQPFTAVHTREPSPQPRPEPPSNGVVKSYATLMKSVRSAGLLRRRRLFYVVLFAVLMAALAGAWTGFFLLQDSWFQLLIAGVLGVLFTQFAFLAHEASHYQVFASHRLNEWSARVLGCFLVGMSYAAWTRKHNLHHLNPNTIDKDPDIHTGVLAFHEEGAATKHGVPALLTRRQGYFFFPLLLFLGFSLLVDSGKVLLARRGVRYRYVEILVLTTRFVLYLALLFLVLPAGMACVFLAVQMAVFGIYMGASFAPNHKGMPVLAATARVDFLSRQVLTSGTSGAVSSWTR